MKKVGKKINVQEWHKEIENKNQWKKSIWENRLAIKRQEETDRARQTESRSPWIGLRSWYTNNLDQPKGKATKMKSDQILFHPVLPKRQASQNDRLANGTTNQNELAPYLQLDIRSIRPDTRVGGALAQLFVWIRVAVNTVDTDKYCIFIETSEGI